jgi:hypothetical protein
MSDKQKVIVLGVFAKTHLLLLDKHDIPYQMKQFSPSTNAVHSQLVLYAFVWTF